MNNQNVQYVQSYHNEDRQPFQQIIPNKINFHENKDYEMDANGSYRPHAQLQQEHIAKNENVDPSQNENRRFIEVKSGINNNDAPHFNHAQNNNLYVRRRQNNDYNRECLQIDIRLHDNVNFNDLSSGNSNSFIATNNDNPYLLSSASSTAPYYSSHSQSFSEGIPNENNLSSKKKKKKKNSSLFRKLFKLKNKRSEINEDEDGDINLNDDMNINDEEMNNLDEEEVILPLIDIEEAEDVFTPLTGNTPRLNRKITPISNVDEYSADYITAIIGKDTFKKDYISELFEEERRERNKWYNEAKENKGILFIYLL